MAANVIIDGEATPVVVTSRQTPLIITSLGGATVAPTGGSSGTSDHGALTGLADDDHVQYLTTARAVTALASVFAPTGQYLTESAAATAYSPTGHTHSQYVTGGPFDAQGTAAGLVDDLSGVSNQATARTNLGLGTAAVAATGDFAAASHTHTGTQVTVDASGFNGNLTTSDDTVQEIAQKLDDLVISGSETLPASIIDAKGDLIVGTAADTPARLAVGTNAKALVADSTATAGVSWQHPLHFSCPAGEYVGMIGRDVDYAVLEMSVAGRLVIVPILVTPGAVDRIMVRVTTGGTATWRLGFYPMLLTGLPDWANVVDGGTVDMSGSAGVREVTISNTIAGMWIWGAILVDAYTSNPATYCARGNNGTGNPNFPGMGQMQAFEGYNARSWSSISTGALPTSAPSGNGQLLATSPTMRFRRA